MNYSRFRLATYVLPSIEKQFQPNRANSSDSFHRNVAFEFLQTVGKFAEETCGCPKPSRRVFLKKYVWHYTKGMSIEDFVEKSPDALQDLIALSIIECPVVIPDKTMDPTLESAPFKLIMSAKRLRQIFDQPEPATCRSCSKRTRCGKFLKPPTGEASVLDISRVIVGHHQLCKLHLQDPKKFPYLPSIDQLTTLIRVVGHLTTYGEPLKASSLDMAPSGSMKMQSEVLKERAARLKERKERLKTAQMNNLPDWLQVKSTKNIHEDKKINWRQRWRLKKEREANDDICKESEDNKFVWVPEANEELGVFGENKGEKVELEHEKEKNKKYFLPPITETNAFNSAENHMSLHNGSVVSLPSLDNLETRHRFLYKKDKTRTKAVLEFSQAYGAFIRTIRKKRQGHNAEEVYVDIDSFARQSQASLSRAAPLSPSSSQPSPPDSPFSPQTLYENKDLIAKVENASFPPTAKNGWIENDQWREAFLEALEDSEMSVEVKKLLGYGRHISPGALVLGGEKQIDTAAIINRLSKIWHEKKFSSDSSPSFIRSIPFDSPDQESGRPQTAMPIPHQREGTYEEKPAPDRRRDMNNWEEGEGVKIKGSRMEKRNRSPLKEDILDKLKSLANGEVPVKTLPSLQEFLAQEHLDMFSKEKRTDEQIKQREEGRNDRVEKNVEKIERDIYDEAVLANQEIATSATSPERLFRRRKLEREAQHRLEEAKQNYLSDMVDAEGDEREIIGKEHVQSSRRQRNSMRTLMESAAFDASQDERFEKWKQGRESIEQTMKEENWEFPVTSLSGKLLEGDAAEPLEDYSDKRSLYDIQGEVDIDEVSALKRDENNDILKFYRRGINEKSTIPVMPIEKDELREEARNLARSGDQIKAPPNKKYLIASNNVFPKVVDVEKQLIHKNRRAMDSPIVRAPIAILASKVSQARLPNDVESLMRPNTPNSSNATQMSFPSSGEGKDKEKALKSMSSSMFDQWLNNSVDSIQGKVQGDSRSKKMTTNDMQMRLSKKDWQRKKRDEQFHLRNNSPKK